MSESLQIGKAYQVIYPFCREQVTLCDGEGVVATESWRPGTRDKFSPPDDTERVADAVGAMILTVVSIHKPGPGYPARVFFTRRWRDPEGKEFGKSGLRILVHSEFMRRLKGYYYRYRLVSAVAEDA